jgi:hypothetical protein
MAIRANWSKISNGVDHVLVIDLRKRHDVMNVDETGSDFAVSRLEVDATRPALAAIMRNAMPPGFGVSLVGVDRHLHCSSFDKGALAWALVGEEHWSISVAFQELGRVTDRVRSDEAWSDRLSC